MLNFQHSLFFLFCTACWTAEAPPLPKTQLDEYRPIIRQFRYNQLQGWVIKPTQVQQNILLLTAQVESTELACFEQIAQKEPMILFVLTTLEQKNAAEQYISALNAHPYEIKELVCP